LSEAGYDKGFKTKLRVTSANQDAVAMVTAAQAYLGAVGIDAEVEVMGFPAIANYTEKGWDNALMIGQIGLQNDVGSSIERSISGTGRRAHSLIAPADYDAVLQQALAEPNIEAKKKNVQELMKLAIDKYAQVLPLYVDTSIIVHSKKLNNASFNQINTEWWAPADAWLSK
jgi:ABC-type transport system substrate-binding protein